MSWRDIQRLGTSLPTLVHFLYIFICHCFAVFDFREFSYGLFVDICFFLLNCFLLFVV